MNGRIFDYNVGRFIGVDPVFQFPTNSQSANPYSYILNNPMAGTDPTGYSVENSLLPEIEAIIPDCAGSADKTCRATKKITAGGKNDDKKAKGGKTHLDVNEKEEENESDGTNQSGKPTDNSFNLFDSATYPGVEAGENAAMYWAQKEVDTGNPLYAIPGVFASLWTPETAGATALTLSGEGALAFGPKVGFWATKIAGTISIRLSSSMKRWETLADGTNQGFKHFVNYMDKFPDRLPSLERRLGVDAGTFARNGSGFNAFTQQALNVVRNGSSRYLDSGKSIHFMQGAQKARNGTIVIRQNGKLQSMMPGTFNSFKKMN